MSKRRATSNDTSFATGLLHRRVFPSELTSPANTTPVFIADSLDLGTADLPRTPGKVWATEVLKVNYQFDNAEVDATSKNVMWTIGLSTSNASSITTYLGAAPNVSKMWLVDQILDTATLRYQIVVNSTTAAAMYYSPLEVEHELTDLMGRGLLVFSGQLYLLSASTSSDQITTLSCAVEVWFRYVQVPLEYYLSIAQDAAASGI